MCIRDRAGTTGAGGSAAGTTGAAGSRGGTTGTAGSAAGTGGSRGGTTGTAGTTGAAGSRGGTTGTAGTTGSAGSNGMCASPIASTSTRPQLTSAEAANYTIAKYFASGPDAWDPTPGLGSASSFTPNFTVAADGSGTHTTVCLLYT